MKPEEVYTALESAYFGENAHEQAEIKALASLLSDVDLFIDAGASLGQYTYHANRILTGGTIIAIEADPVRYKRLRELCTEWSKSSTNTLIPLHYALSDSDGQITFYVTDSAVSGALNLPPERLARSPNAKSRGVSVSAKTLDQIIAQYAPDDARGGLIKLDVEGAEHRVILGSVETLSHRHYPFLVELHSWGDPSLQVGPKDTISLFEKYMYDHQPFLNHRLFKWVPSRSHFVLGRARRWLKRQVRRITHIRR